MGMDISAENQANGHHGKQIVENTVFPQMSAPFQSLTCPGAHLTPGAKKKLLI